jgi:hypothetical protein
MFSKLAAHRGKKMLAMRTYLISKVELSKLMGVLEAYLSHIITQRSMNRNNTLLSAFLNYKAELTLAISSHE